MDLVFFCAAEKYKQKDAARKAQGARQSHKNIRTEAQGARRKILFNLCLVYILL
jgi:hypothetical protein